MRVLITGAAGFVGSTLARSLIAHSPELEVIGLDNYYRPGSETNRQPLRAIGIDLRHGDIRQWEDLAALPKLDWVIDAAALPSVLAGRTGGASSRLLMNHNLLGTVNLLELCKRDQATFTLMSSSRVYSVPTLASTELEVRDDAFHPVASADWPEGISPLGVSELCSTEPPVSLYGSTKRCSEQLALEYSAAFDFPVWVLRSGVLSGAGQFGTAEQGIFSYWIHAYRSGRTLRYIGFDGRGHQVRDCLHPRDLVPLMWQQVRGDVRSACPRILNVSGGLRNSMSLRQLSDWCADRFGTRAIAADHSSRTYDVGWLVLDSTQASGTVGWAPTTSLQMILEEIAAHAEANPDWLELSGA